MKHKPSGEFFALKKVNSSGKATERFAFTKEVPHTHSITLFSLTHSLSARSLPRTTTTLARTTTTAARCRRYQANFLSGLDHPHLLPLKGFYYR